MKKLLTIFKNLNSFTNNELTAKEEAAQIMKFLLLKNSTAKSIEIFEALEIAMKFEMQQREAEAAYTCRLINSKWQSKVIAKLSDPNFDKPLAEINVEYQIVKS
jgi:hypothetical protein